MSSCTMMIFDSPNHTHKASLRYRQTYSKLSLSEHIRLHIHIYKVMMSYIMLYFYNMYSYCLFCGVKTPTETMYGKKAN